MSLPERYYWCRLWLTYAVARRAPALTSVPVPLTGHTPPADEAAGAMLVRRAPSGSSRLGTGLGAASCLRQCFASLGNTNQTSPA